jgi:hypothetical protein
MRTGKELRGPTPLGEPSLIFETLVIPLPDTT